MPRRILLCHDCREILSDNDREHYCYQCHDCVMLEHERLRLVTTDPLHPDAEHLDRSAVALDWAPRKIDLPRRVA